MKPKDAMLVLKQRYGQSPDGIRKSAKPNEFYLHYRLTIKFAEKFPPSFWVQRLQDAGVVVLESSHRRVITRVANSLTIGGVVLSVLVRLEEK